MSISIDRLLAAGLFPTPEHRGALTIHGAQGVRSLSVLALTRGAADAASPSRPLPFP